MAASMVAPGGDPQRRANRHRYTVVLTSGEKQTFEAQEARTEGTELVFSTDGREVRRIAEADVESWTSDPI